MDEARKRRRWDRSSQEADVSRCTATLERGATKQAERKALVEIGSEYGPTTRKLLEFCHRHGAELHVIEPLPKYDVAAWQERYGEHLVFHRAPSLDALATIDRFDAVLIDGDHNWYTVFNELKLIEERCKASSQPFPLVMLHDVGWPYGRRDRYHNPDNIPDKYLKPHYRKSKVLRTVVNACFTNLAERPGCGAC